MALVILPNHSPAALLRGLGAKLFLPKTLRLGIFGTRGAGKTVYIARYYQYIREEMSDEWNASCDNEETSQYLRQILDAIDQGNLVETRANHPLNLTITRKKNGFYQSFKLELVDISGEELSQFQNICQDIENCDGAVLVVDPMNITDREKEVYQRLLSRLAQKRTRSLFTSWTPPLSFVFTKLDHPDCPAELKEDALGDEEIFSGHTLTDRARYFARRSLPGNFKTAAAQFPKANYFAISAFGDWMEEKDEAGEIVLVPDPDKPPIGLHSPLEWLCDQIIYRRFKISLYRLGLVLMGLLAVMATVLYIFHS